MRIFDVPHFEAVPIFLEDIHRWVECATQAWDFKEYKEMKSMPMIYDMIDDWKTVHSLYFYDVVYVAQQL